MKQKLINILKNKRYTVLDYGGNGYIERQYSSTILQKLVKIDVLTQCFSHNKHKKKTNNDGQKG